MAAKNEIEKKGLAPVLNEKGKALSRVDLEKFLKKDSLTDTGMHASDTDWDYSLRMLTLNMDRNSTKYLDTLISIGDHLVSEKFLDISYNHFKKISDIYNRIESIPLHNPDPSLDYKIENVFDRQFIYFLNRYVKSEFGIPRIDSVIQDGYYLRFTKNTPNPRRALKLAETGIVSDPEAQIQIGEATSECLRNRMILDKAYGRKDEIDVVLDYLFDMCAKPSTYLYGDLIAQYTKRYYELKQNAIIDQEVFDDGLFDECSPIIEKAILYGDISAKDARQIITI